MWQVRKAILAKRAASIAASMSCRAAFAAWCSAAAELADAAHAQLQAAQAFAAGRRKGVSQQ